MEERLKFVNYSVKEQHNVVLILNDQRVVRGKALSLFDNLLTLENDQQVSLNEIVESFVIPKNH